jgi:hypothetical protein
MRKGIFAIVAAAGALYLAPPTASADTEIVTFGMSNAGVTWLDGGCGVGCNVVNFSGTSFLSGLVGFFPSNHTPSFTFTGQLDVTESGSAGIGSDGTWALHDSHGDSLFGQFEGSVSGSPTDFLRSGQFLYSALGGTGVFGGAEGLGFTTLTFGNFPSADDFGDFSQTGQFTLDVPPPVSVPEPGTFALFGAGLFGLLWTTTRSRRTVASSLTA